MSAVVSVTATFALTPVTYTLGVTKAGTGSGTVTSSPAGISCGATCSAPYVAGTVVTLTATPATGWAFAAWSGACSGAGACQVTMSAARDVIATFEPPTASAALSFYTLTPCRAIDTRRSAGPLGGPALAAGTERSFMITGTCGIPTTAQAVSGNITATGSTKPGHLRLYPAGTAVPVVSSINYVSGQTRANNAIAQLNDLGELAVFTGQASGTVHLILDVNGYFQ
jgi:hypothetical protein